MLKSIKSDWGIQSNSKIQDYCDDKTGKDGGVSLIKICKSNSRKSQNENFRNDDKNSSDVDINRGKMTEYISTLPSQFNDSRKCHTPPIMGDTVGDVKSRNSCCVSVDTGVGVGFSINNNKSNGCTSGVVLDSYCIETSKGDVQVLNSSQLSFKYLQ